MIIINRNNLSLLAQKHYNEFFVKRGFLNSLREIKDKETDVLRKKFFTYLFDNIEDIIMGNPERLSQILRSIIDNNKFIMHQITKYNVLERKLKKEKEKEKNLRDEQKILIKANAQQSQLSEIENKIILVKRRLQYINYHLEKVKDLNKKIKKVFDYETKFCGQYTKGKKAKSTKWGAYELVKSLKIGACPYCNRQFITVVEPQKGEKGRTRPELDHFYSKSRYPFFAVSFFNLIPCCHICNSNLKRNEEFDIETHLHPYEQGFGNLVEFTVKFKEIGDEIDYVNAWLHTPHMLSIGFKLNEIERQKYSRSELKSLLYKINNNKRAFKLRSLYNAHTDYVGEIIAKTIEYNDDKIETMCRDFPELFPKKEDAVRLIYSNYVETEDMDKRVLAKLTRDITKEFGIKYT